MCSAFLPNDDKMYIIERKKYIHYSLREKSIIIIFNIISHRLAFLLFEKYPRFHPHGTQSLYRLTRDSRRAAAIITNPLSREFPRKRPEPGFNGSIRMFRQLDVWADGLGDPSEIFFWPTSSRGEDALLGTPTQRDKTCALSCF